ncbi:hypothetical protein GH866_00915 [Bacillus thuringiensis]|nr:hypothetical protein [Bacillus thuringiensis]
MGVKIGGNKFINGNTAIQVVGLMQNMNISDNEFINNMKDMDFYIDEDSDIVIENNFSDGCKTESITIKEFSSKIEDVKEFAENIPDFTTEEKEKIKTLLDEMNASKDEPTKIKKILKEIYDVGKSTSSGLLLTYIKMRIGW